MVITEEELQNIFVLYETSNFKLNDNMDKEEELETATMIAHLVKLKYDNFIEEYDLKLP